ncbi:MAG TPA: biopolymer transporter TolR, partial [Flavilitoribacter sp.]|nr:biopolymer transporter TolR [Flavilitoribacter sp.]
MMFFAQSNFGVFRDAGDVGAVLHKGSTQYNSATQKYQLSGSGENIWFAKDEFQYAWKKVKGDFILQARGKLIGKGVDPHRKFGWMVRANLDTGSPMAAATVHGDGLTSLQYRLQQDTDIAENKSAVVGPDVIRLERKGNKFIMSV